MFFRGNFGTVSSFVICEDLIDGRLSFGGENPEIERLMELEQLEKLAKTQPPKNETDVSDAEMAQRWRSTTKINVTNMQQTKKHPRSDSDSNMEPMSKKPKFLKPRD